MLWLAPSPEKSGDSAATQKMFSCIAPIDAESREKRRLGYDTKNVQLHCSD